MKSYTGERNTTGDILRSLSAISSDLGNYDSRKIGRKDVGGLTVSTAYTSDYGFETAIIDANGVHPVERYGEDRIEALSGHGSWEEKANTLTEITELGYGSLVGKTKVVLKRGKL